MKNSNASSQRVADSEFQSWSDCFWQATVANVYLWKNKIAYLGKGPKIKKARKCGLWPYPADPPPLILTMVFLLRIFHPIF